MPEVLHRSELQQVNSEELQEIVGQPPRGIVRWGTASFMLVLIIILVAAVFVKYVDVLSGHVTLAAANSPKSVVSKTDGKLVKLLVKGKEVVQQGQVLAYLESSASHPDVIRLANELDSCWARITREEWNNLFEHQPAFYQQLGELQHAYQVFMAAYIQLNAYLADNMYQKRRNLLLNELENLDAQAKNLEAQDAVSKRDFAIAEEDFGAKKRLHDEKVLSHQEFRQEESRYLAKKMPAMQIRTSIINNNTAMANKRQELILFEQQFADQKSTFLQALNTLISNVEEWKKKYLLIAPVTGMVSLPVLLQDKQDVKSGQELFYITPENTGYYAEIYLPQINSGKLGIGQQVLISLNGYPYAEYGKLRGKISFISEFPDKEGQYYLGVTLDDGLRTDMMKEITYRNGLTGTAEVITNKTRLINKLLYTFREILNKPRSLREGSPATAD